MEDSERRGQPGPRKRRSMWRWALGALLALGGCAGASGAVAQTEVEVIEADEVWIGGSPADTRVIVGSGGETYVGVWVDTPDVPSARLARPPMAVSLVVDTSGSMAGDKIAQARRAAQALVESLADDDVVSVYGFSNQVVEIAPPMKVDARTRQALLGRIAGLRAGGGTNLHDGVAVGIARTGDAPATHTVRRVFLISDGHANIGPTDARTLGVLAAAGTEYGTQVTAIGVGSAYDENTLGTLAVSSSGRLHHLANASHLGRNPGARGLPPLPRARDRRLHRDHPGPRGAHPRRGDPRDRAPGRSAPRRRRDAPRRAAAGGALPAPRCPRPDPAGGALVRRAWSTETPPGGTAHASSGPPIRYEVTRDRAAAARSEAPRVVAMVATHEAAEAQLRAAESLNRGDTTTAVAALEVAERRLRTAASRSTAPAARRRLRRQADAASERRVRAGRASSPAAAREEALEAFGGAYDANGY